MKKSKSIVEIRCLHFIDTDGTIFETSDLFAQAHKLKKKGLNEPFEITFDDMTKPMWFGTWVPELNEDGSPVLDRDGEELYKLIPYTAKITGTLKAVLKGPLERAQLTISEQPSIAVVGYDLYASRSNIG